MIDRDLAAVDLLELFDEIFLWVGKCPWCYPSGDAVAGAFTADPIDFFRHAFEVDDLVCFEVAEAVVAFFVREYWGVFDDFELDGLLDDILQVDDVWLGIEE